MTTHVGDVLDRIGDYGIITCQSCNFKHIIPLPTEKDLEKFYRNRFYTETRPRYLQEYEEDREWWFLIFDNRLQIIEGLLPDKLYRSVIDIGSGPGLFCKVAKKRGWQYIGLEPSRVACDHSRAKNLNIIHDFLVAGNACNLPRVDAVHLHEVLEHTLDPKNFLLLCRDLLNYDGLLIVTCPNDYNDWQLAFEERWWLAPIEHINYFDHKSLGELLVNCGFEVLINTTSFPLELFKLLGWDYTQNAELGRELHHRRTRMELKLAKDKRQWRLLQELYAGLAAIGLGRETTFIVRKKQLP